MRPNNSSKRQRSRNRSKNSNPLARSYESNGPDVKIRGSALQVADKYAQLARDAQSSGDRVMAENYFQHAEHYYRIVAQAYEQNGQNPRERRDDREEFGRDDQQPEITQREADEPPSGTGEQPRPINGHDAASSEDDGLRRTLRANGNGETQPTLDLEKDVGSSANGDGAIVEAEAVATVSAAAPEADESAAAADDAAEEPAPAPAPKRRTRTTRTPRTRRTRRTAEPEAAASASESSDPAS